MSINYSGIVSCLSAISAGFLTFINPSKRSAKEQKKAVKSERFYNYSLNIKTLIDCSNDQEDIIKKIEDLTKEYTDFLKEMEQYSD